MIDWVKEWNLLMGEAFNLDTKMTVSSTLFLAIFTHFPSSSLPLPSSLPPALMDYECVQQILHYSGI